MLVLFQTNDLGSGLLYFGIFLGDALRRHRAAPGSSRRGWCCSSPAPPSSTRSSRACRNASRSGATRGRSPTTRATRSCSRTTRSANGGFGGTGLGKGTFTTIEGDDVIPFLKTDFIYSALAQELGLVGSAALLLVFMLFALRGFRIALLATDGFSKLLAVGLTFGFALQTFIIVGGVVRLIPLTGITLPFVSYGGSSLLANFLLLAGLLLVSNRANARLSGDDEPADHARRRRRARPARRADRRDDLLADAGPPPGSPTGRTTRSSGWRSSRSSAARSSPPTAAPASRGASSRKVQGKTLYFRRYPQGGLRAHVVGYSTAVRSRAGLERSMNDYLTALEREPRARSSTRRSTSCAGGTIEGNDLDLDARPRRAARRLRAARPAAAGRSSRWSRRPGRVLVMALVADLRPEPDGASRGGCAKILETRPLPVAVAAGQPRHVRACTSPARPSRS